MVRRQGATRKHVLIDLRPRSNAGAGPFSTQPSGPQFFERISASLARPVSQRIPALHSLLEICPNSVRRLASHTGFTTLNHGGRSNTSSGCDGTNAVFHVVRRGAVVS